MQKEPENPDLYNKYKSTWEQGKDYEVNFWDKYIKSSGANYGNDYTNRTNPDHPLQPHIAKFLNHLNEPEVNILDVGAGPLTVLGKKLPSKKLKIIAVDPLADEYDEALEHADIIPLVRTTWCQGELLLERFKPASFHLTYAQNCLDHSYHPLQIIQNMLSLVKENCYVILEHAQNEAENENYRGFHQWNFTVENNDLILWNKEMTQNVTAILEPQAEVKCQFNEKLRWILVSIKKLPVVPDTNLKTTPQKKPWWKKFLEK